MRPASDISTAAIVITESAPAFHGLYRAITSTSLHWTLDEWERITKITSDIFAPDTVDRLNSLLADYLTHSDDLLRKTMFIRTIVSRYSSANRPLSGYFAVCGVMEIQWTILAQVLVPPLAQPPVASTSQGVLPSAQSVEAQASNAAWGSLMSKPCRKIDMDVVDPDAISTVSKCLEDAAQCFTDLLEQIEEYGEVDPEMYAFETLSESLVRHVCRMLQQMLIIPKKLATVCSLALDEIDPVLFERVKLILSKEAPVVDAFLQDAALKSATVLVQK